MFKTFKENHSLYMWLILGSLLALGGLVYFNTSYFTELTIIWSKMSMYIFVLLGLYKMLSDNHKHVNGLYNFILCAFIFWGFIFVTGDENLYILLGLMLILSSFNDLTPTYMHEGYSWKYTVCFSLIEIAFIFLCLFGAKCLEVDPVVQLIFIACFMLYKLLQAFRLKRNRWMGLVFYAIFLTIFASQLSLDFVEGDLAQGFGVYFCEIVMLFGFWKVSIRNIENFKTVTFPFYYSVSFVYLCIRIVISLMSFCFPFYIGPLYFDLYFLTIDILATVILFCSIYQGELKEERAYHMYKQKGLDSSWIQAGLDLSEFYLNQDYYDLAAEVYCECLPVVWKHIDEDNNKYILCKMLVSFCSCVESEEVKEAAKTYCEIYGYEDECINE